MKHIRPSRPRPPQKKRKNNDFKLYKLIKTTKNNVIIREDSTQKLALFQGSTGKILRNDKIENYGYCLKLSHQLFATKHVAGNFATAIQSSKELLGQEDGSPPEQAQKEKENFVEQPGRKPQS